MLKNVQRSALFFLFSTIGVFQTPAATIIFDLGDVLVETKYAQSMWSIGPTTMAAYAITLHNPFTCNKKLYQFLDSIKPFNPKQVHIKDHHGNILPQLIADWLSGSIPYTMLLATIDATPGNFSNWAEERLVRSLANTIFDPINFVKTRCLVPDGVAFVQACKNAGHSIYILSNWDPASFILMEEKYPEFFSLFDGIMISGDVGLLKPDPRIYKLFLARFNLDPRYCVFLDDQPDNIIAAQNEGIHGILYCKKPGLLFHYPNFQAVKEQINQWLASKNFAITIDN